jgi:hypothetical protein
MHGLLLKGKGLVRLTRHLKWLILYSIVCKVILQPWTRNQIVKVLKYPLMMKMFWFLLLDHPKGGLNLSIDVDEGTGSRKT